MSRSIFSGILILIASIPAFSQERSVLWADSVYETMSTEQRLGQLFMVAAYSNGDAQHAANLVTLVTKEHIGGLLFMQGGPGRQLHLTNRLQAESQLPLMVGMDLEWGLAMRLDSTQQFPRQMEMGAVQDNDLIRRMGKEIGRQMNILGVHINFAPVADVNNNPDNPVIGTRSFGENKFLVAEKSMAYMQGLQQSNVMAVAKHFPGHGDTDKDSHETLPVIRHKKARIDDVESYPFRKLIQAGVGGIMTAHLQLDDLDRNYPASLSEKITSDYLKEELGYGGLVFTDALNMKAVTDQYAAGEAELQAFRAGADVLLFSTDVPTAKQRILEAMENNAQLQERLEQSVKKILQAKYKFGLNNWKKLNSDNLHNRLNSAEGRVIIQGLHEKSITLLKNKDQTIPVRQLDNRRFAMIHFGEAGKFPDYLNRYTTFTLIDSTLPTDQLARKLSEYNVIVAGIFPNQSDDALAEIADVLGKVGKDSKVIACYFGNPYRIAELDGLDNVITAYGNNNGTQVAMAEALFGAISVQGKLPVSVSRQFAYGAGEKTAPLGRLGYGEPEAQGMDGKVLAKIDELAREAVEIGATPGCQVLVAKDGKVVYMKNFGYQTYDSLRPVNDNTVYDLASVTKVLASTQALMFLEERGLIDMDKKLSTYLPELKGSNKENMILRDILTHQAGLWVYLPFYAQTLDGREFMPEYYHPKPTPVYTMKVADGLYAKPLVKDSLYQWVINSRVRKKSLRVPYEYKYSDMGYYLTQHMIEKMISQSISDFMLHNFYEPMGMTSTGYRPLDRFPRERIAPTEQDNFFRKTLVEGMVHDQGAALMGGVAGHAGLFGTANDLAKNMQMLLQGGQYGGNRYFQRETVLKFTEKQYANNRRGMGWDKPLMGEWFGPTSEYASEQTFGHTGFTGTAVWADPEFDLIYVFLANRIYPDAGNSKLLKENIRTRIQNVIYRSIFEYQSTQEVN